MGNLSSKSVSLTGTQCGHRDLTFKAFHVEALLIEMCHDTHDTRKCYCGVDATVPA